MKRLLLLLPLLMAPAAGHSKTTTLICEASFTKATGPHPQLAEINNHFAKAGGTYHEIIIDPLMSSARVGSITDDTMETLGFKPAQLLITDDSYMLHKTEAVGNSTTIDRWAINRVNADLIQKYEVDYGTENMKFKVHYKGKCTKKKTVKTLF